MTLSTAATLVALTHTDSRTMEAALVKLGAAHIIVRIADADVRFSRKNGLRISGHHERGKGYCDWYIAADALQALTGEPATPALSGPANDEPVTVQAGEKLPGHTIPAAPAVEEPAAPAKKERKPRAKKAPALGVPTIAAEPDLTVDPGHPATMEQEAADAPSTVDQDVFQAPAPDEFPAQLPEMTETVEQVGNPMTHPPVATEAPSAAPEEPAAPAHRDAVVPPPAEAQDAPVVHPLLQHFDLSLADAMTRDPRAGASFNAFRGVLVEFLVATALKPAKAPRAAKPVSDAPKTFRGDTTAKPGVLTDLQQKLMRTVGNGLAKARREAGDTTPVTAADALATNSPWFARLAKDKHQQGAQFAADHANEKLSGPASVPPPAKGSAGKKAAKPAPAKKAPAKKKTAITAGCKVDIKESVRDEYADVVGESQMTGLEVLSITGKNARCKTNAGVTLPKVALADLALAA